MEYPGEFVEALLGLSRSNLTEGTGIEPLLAEVADLAVAQLDGCDMAGVTMMADGRLQTTVFTDKEAPEIDSAQYESGSGPCIQAFRTGSMYRVDDTEDESRWPEFVAAAREHGVRSTLSLPLSSEEQPIGALNLYSSKVAAFDDSEQMAMVFVAHAASVLGNAAAYWEGRTLSEQLQSALMSRPVIEQAKGILMREHGCDADQAFTMLSRISQHSNRKLRDVASDVVGEAVTGQRPHLGGETDPSPPPS